MLRTEPPVITALLEEGLKAHEQGDFSHAAACYNKVLEEAPHNPEALHLCGVLHFQAKNLPKAVEFITKALAVAPKNHRYYNSLGLVCRHMGKLAQALTHFDAALALAPDYADALSNKAIVLVSQGKKAEALPLFEKTANLNPHNPEVLVNYAHTLWDEGRVADALPFYEQACKVSEGGVRYLLNFAAAKLSLGAREEAMALYAKALEKEPNEPTATHILASFKGENPPAAPEGYVRTLFDRYADSFDQHLHELGYEVPALLRALVPGVMPSVGGWSLLDLGCGTGACGREFALLCRTIVGVDLSREMLEKAEKTNAYTALYPMGLVPFLQQERGTYDLVFAADVFVYVGKLEAVFKEVARLLTPEGIFAFSTEVAFEDEPECFLRQTARFAHSQAYIHTLARAFGFAIAIEKSIAVRTDEGKGIPGYLYVLKKESS